MSLSIFCKSSFKSKMYFYFRSQLVSETDNDSATQFLNNPMFDSIKTKRAWGVKRKAKYSLNSSSNSATLSSRCSIM